VPEALEKCEYRMVAFEGLAEAEEFSQRTEAAVVAKSAKTFIDGCR